MKVCPLCKKEYSDTSTLCPVDGEVLLSTEDPLIGQTLADKYLVEQLIKRGGMGAVYKGRHVLMDKTVAVKVLRRSLAVDEQVVARFSREAKAASRISHPHAVSVTDFGESENGVLFLIMEYLDGRTLKEVISAEGPMTLPRVAEIIRQVAGALDAAHQQGVVHRDLKSDNIMLSEAKGGDWAKVLDFGIAKIQQPEGARAQDITTPNLVIGTPHYMSPEQCTQTRTIDARSDVYSLGIIVFEMLTGRVPFTGESPTVIMMKQLQDEPPLIRSIRPELPPAVDNFIKRALAKDPANRFQTADELSEALTQISAVGSPAADALAAAPVTVPNAPVTDTDDVDEPTLVRSREDERLKNAHRVVPRPIEPKPGLGNIHPWRIMIPAVVVLVAVFGVVFLLTRGSGQTTTNQNQNTGAPGLTADPNSQPVQPVGPATGESERGIQPRSTPSPLPSITNSNVNPDRGFPPPAPVDTSMIDNSNVAVPANRNANQRQSPTPRPSPTVEKSPSPKPTPPKPAQTPKNLAQPAITPPDV